jgi:predicted transcriptional regulator
MGKKRKIIDGSESSPSNPNFLPPGVTISIKGGTSLPTLIKDEDRKPPVVVNSNRPKMFREDGSFNQDLFFEIIGNDIRRKILMKLAKFPRYASDLAIDMAVSKQAVKKHLNKLLEFGLIEEVPSERFEQKIQYYQISSSIAIFANVDLTPNFFQSVVENTPESLVEGLANLTHNPTMALISPQKGGTNYHDLNFALGILGQKLNQVEKKIAGVEDERNKALIEKMVLLNQVQFIINALVENDLEKEVIFSLFFDLKTSIEGVSVMDIVNKLFLRKRKRAGVPFEKHDRPDPKMLERGKDLLELLRLLIRNFGFVRTEGSKLFFEFKEDEN